MLRRSILVVVPLLFALLAARPAAAQEAPYTEGSVWQLTFVRVTAGMEDDYLKSLGGTYKKVFEEAKKQGLVLSYKILSGSAGGKDDWDMLLMVEYKNMSALDGLDAKFRAIESKLIGNEDAQRSLMTKRLEIRQILGGKLMRELYLK